MVQGMEELSVPLGLTLISTAQMQTNLSAFITQDGAFNAARSAQQTASDAWATAQAAIYAWLLGVSNTLATHFGTRWNTQWAQAGFINNTTAIPAKIEDRLGLTLALVNFFTAQPTYEVATLNQTAAYGTTLRTTAVNAQAAVTAATVTINNIGALWQTAYDTLVKGMRSLIMNLTDKLSDSDPRWLNFGLQMPSTITTPGKPVNLTASLDQTGAIVVQCDAVPLATRYRWRMLLVGLQQDYELAASTPGPIGSITGVAPSQTAQIIVQAVNNGLQGVASDPITFAVPTASQSVPPPASAPVEVSTPKTSANGNGNGSGNGNGNGHGNGYTNGNGRAHGNATPSRVA
jgi:hypothetical protein